jgi:predicted phosphoribosyltransferase
VTSVPNPTAPESPSTGPVSGNVVTGEDTVVVGVVFVVYVVDDGFATGAVAALTVTFAVADGEMLFVVPVLGFAGVVV